MYMMVQNSMREVVWNAAIF